MSDSHAENSASAGDSAEEREGVLRQELVENGRKYAAKLAKTVAYAMAMVTRLADLEIVTPDEFEEMLDLETSYLDGMTYGQILELAQKELG